MDEVEFKSKLFFYLREGYYYTAQSVALDGLIKYPNNNLFKYVNALCMLLSNRSFDAIREFKIIQSEKEIVFAAIMGHKAALEATEKYDKKILQLDHLKNEMIDVRNSVDSNGYLYTALFLFYNSELKQARELIRKSLKLNPENIDAILMKGWIDYYFLKMEIILRNESNPNLPNELIHNFSSVLNKNKKYFDAAIGEVEFYLFGKKFELALSTINKAVVKHSNLVEPLICKMKIQLALQDWEQTIETMNRIINIENLNLCALKMNILLLLCRDGNYNEAAHYLASFYKVLRKVEPTNAQCFYNIGATFSRVCGKTPVILDETFKFCETAVQIDTKNEDYLNELGYQCLLRGKFEDAIKYYKKSTNICQMPHIGITGLILTELYEKGVTDQVAHQLEFLLETETRDVSSTLLFIQAKVNALRPEKAIKFLTDAIDTHLKDLNLYTFGETYLLKLNPDFLLDIVKEYLKFSPKQLETVAKKKLIFIQSNSIIQKSLNVLKIITKACPGLKEGIYLLAKVQFLIGDSASATNTINQVLKNTDDNVAEAHLLMAQIYISQSLYQRASQSLEMSLSNNFKVREYPLYHFLLGLVYKNEKNIDEAIKSFTTALSLNDVTSKIKNHDLTLSDRGSLYLELISAYAQSGQTHETIKILETAMEQFKGTSEEARIIIMNAEQIMQQKDIKSAIEMLNKIKPTELYYVNARTKLAEIYLKHRRDKSAFMQCFREIVEHCPGPESYLLLGDSYMSIQEPELAIDAYEKALNCNPKDPILASKMGIALVKTHQYNKAVNYYKEAIKLTENIELKIDLTNLFIKLEQYDKGELVMQEELQRNKNSGENDFLSLQYRTKCLMLLAKIREQAGNIKGAFTSLKEARECQNRVEKRISLEQPGSSNEHMRTSIEIYTRMAELSIALRDNEKAAAYYKEALTLSASNSEILAALAMLYLQMNYLELCHQTCSALLKVDPENDLASVMMADLAFRKIDFDTAAYHYKQILNKQPTNWMALGRLVEVMRRIGTLSEVSTYLHQAEDACGKSKEAGLCYCYGLYEWYSGNPNSALKYLNNARQDTEWGQKVIFSMIEICLNPDDEMVSEDNFEQTDDLDYIDAKSMALKTAERLLKELKLKPGGIDDETLRQRLLKNFLLLATKQKSNIEEALDDFSNLASKEAFKDHIGPILGSASAYILLKQTQRARTQLKRVAKNMWTFDDAEYLERCWLLLADMYIQSAKYDLAMDLLRRILQHNKTCTKAYEFCGYIAEKEQHYKEAANYYDSAWKYSGKVNPVIGYKLGFCYLKCKKYADAVEVSNFVLKMQPDYPKIKKDILDKALNNLRT